MPALSKVPRILNERETKIVASDVNVYYGEKQAIKNLSIDIPDRAVSAFIGPSGCCLLYTSPSPRDRTRSRMPSSA